MSTVRVRFAPSPTGYLHIGGARTALYNWLFARKHHGTFVLRIEDTDVERSTHESLSEILDGLTWLGLTWDEGPHFQSERIASHQKAARQLLNSGHAYRCFCTKEELEAKRVIAQQQKLDYKYDGTCRNLSPDEIRLRQEQGMPSVVRFKVPSSDGSVVFEDKVYGAMEKRYCDIEDFVILRSDGKPLYVLSNAVDDNMDRITHVIRGQDGLANTPKQILLYRALGYELPVFAHISLTLDTKKAKISKRRHGEVVTVAYYRERGFIPWALCNFLALLGWSSSDDREFFSREELIEAFSLEGIVRHNSIFNYVPGDPDIWTDPKAINMNARYLSMISLDELIPLVREELRSAGLWDEAFDSERRAWFAETVNLIRTRYYTLKDFSSRGRCYFSDNFPFEPVALDKNLKKDAAIPEYLKILADALENTASFDTDHAEQTVRKVCESLQIKPGLLINAVRTAVTGQMAGPGLFEILEVLGKEKTVQRLRSAAGRLEQNVL
ncbi:MAG TPA: glutamate--tRNA ligase [Thermodesulfobacteriota bacterium]|nr:glutamate--tRNA ligase [Deltaproteobacteria bacterium]HNR12910.1 glutamate--tRNA ligase [Thermodesulfobacteriota bacterium]HNU72047.1 glutamate--tRNA ligase [Thermodesulfobacteriota bacterium]HQO78711.1 glutamate--tRNA ligase [Thermodesulfobacteriota bacterium]